MEFEFVYISVCVCMHLLWMQELLILIQLSQMVNLLFITRSGVNLNDLLLDELMVVTWNLWNLGTSFALFWMDEFMVSSTFYAILASSNINKDELCIFPYL
jgi:hypothetical protein